MTDLTTSFLERGFRNNCGRPPRKDLEKRIAFQEASQRKRAVMLLFVGALSGFLGFAFAGFLGVWEFSRGKVQLNFRGEPMASGRNYFAQTVSELVGDPASPAGKSFFSFCLVGAICMLVSFYPYNLRNAYVGDDDRVLGISWLALRTFLPPIGLMLTVLAPTKPLEQCTFPDYVALVIHCIGAAMMLSGHVTFELHALCCSRVVQISPRERVVRWMFLAGCAFSGVAFVTTGAVAGAISSGRLQVCCTDEWQVPTTADIARARELGHYGIMTKAAEASDRGQRMLLNTASHAALVVKVVEYWLEVSVGLFMIAGLLAIWFFSHERVLDLDADIPDVDPETELASG
uniref:Transmembrane protein n=1 Tax=Alexandrium monilatum TaxID=311494 RepID=A0A7S4QMD6_9DINO|mmetsp:Transcript_37819/g.112912  ORF Transcript_37819/g.112912 Transcript_37819/m.112912 type:complete len:346 (+) Transcript_37819:79-1116(+)|eukprot:CAMPEP_0175188838 /NCGR_PEP_ID=MMETSP0093-20121207/3623_1 /TAXON_ID=311494 /ORGANISM="Alexandrium monilatum, Strain CCMP3105" /LENGTH=345 /DNA_ID=CAMNT_0016481623 /DNA_START=58 /DNA_END=1095 /DNA_ORIENTATION=-